MTDITKREFVLRLYKFKKTNPSPYTLSYDLEKVGINADRVSSMYRDSKRSGCTTWIEMIDVLLEEHKDYWNTPLAAVLSAPSRSSKSPV